MEDSKVHSSVAQIETDEENAFSRKQFLKISGLSAAAAVTLSSCTNVPNAVDDTLPPLEIGPDPYPDNFRIWIGRGDVALMNTIHIYTKLEAAFYNKVLENPFTGMSKKERTIFTALNEHEVAHSDFLGALLGENAVRGFHFNFGYFNFNNRTEILKAAFEFENIGVSIYNTFAGLLKRVHLFPVLTKLGWVEGRHAAAVQFLLDASENFVGHSPVGRDGLDVQNSPQKAWFLFYKYIVEGFDIQGLPGVQADSDYF